MENIIEKQMIGSKKRKEERLMTFKIKCYKRILHIHRQQKITNLEIGQRLDLKKCGANNHGEEAKIVWAHP